MRFAEDVSDHLSVNAKMIRLRLKLSAGSLQGFKAGA